MTARWPRRSSSSVWQKNDFEIAHRIEHERFSDQRGDIGIPFLARKRGEHRLVVQDIRENVAGQVLVAAAAGQFGEAQANLVVGRHGLKRSRLRSALSGWRLFRGGFPCLKMKGVTQSRSFTGTGVPTTERFRAHPSGRASKRRP